LINDASSALPGSRWTGGIQHWLAPVLSLAHLLGGLHGAVA
jgi:hypothetical protein